VIDRDLAGYRQTLYGSASEAKEGKAAIGREEAVRVLEKEKGRLPLPVVLRCRVRYFTEGMVLGSPEFVLEKSKALESGGTRERRAHAMRGADWGGLSVATGLKSRLFG